MNKAQVIANVAERTGLSKRDSAIVVRACIDAFIDGIVEDGTVTLIDFGSFHVVWRSARKARNLNTGEEITVPSKRVPTFRPSRRLKDMVHD